MRFIVTVVLPMGFTGRVLPAAIAAPILTGRHFAPVRAAGIEPPMDAIDTGSIVHGCEPGLGVNGSGPTMMTWPFGV